MSAPAYPIEEARDTLAETSHQRSTQNAALHYIEDPRISIRAAARIWNVDPANVLRALRKVPGVDTTRHKTTTPRSREAARRRKVIDFRTSENQHEA